MSVSRDLDGKLREFTVKDAERVIHKIEACEGMAAKLLLLRNVLALGRAEGLSAIEAWTENEIKLHEENAVKCDSSRNHYGWLWDTNAAVALKNAVEAIRALKEKHVEL